MTPDSSPPQAELPPRPRRSTRGHLGIALVATCVATMLVLTGLATRSYFVEERIDCGWGTGAFHPEAATAWSESSHVKVESALGVLGLAWERHSWADNLVIPADVAEVELQMARLGWSGKWETTRGKSDPFGRSRADVGPWQTLHWEHWSGPVRTFAFGGPGTTEHWGVVLPYWVPILPGLGPLVWWAWCPLGRAIPRLTIGRLLIVTAAAGLILAGLTAFERGVAADRALAVIAEFGGSWSYGPDPGGTGRSVITQIRFAKTIGTRYLTDAEMPRIDAALARFPQLECLAIDFGAAKLTPAGLAVIADRLDLPIVSLSGLPVDDATLALLRNHRRIESLDIGFTAVTDAGLVHLQTLPALQRVDLKGLAITDAGLEHLTRIADLRSLNLGRAGPRGQVTLAATRALLDSIPTLETIGTADSQLLYRERTATRRTPGRSATESAGDPSPAP